MLIMSRFLFPVLIPVSLLDTPFLLPFPLVYARFDKKGEIRRPCVEVRNGNNSTKQPECERITEINDRKRPLIGAITVGLVTDGGLAFLAVLRGNHAEKTPFSRS